MTAHAAPTPRFEDLGLDIFYEGPGEQILTALVLPLLQSSVSYDRVTSFFSVGSLLAIAQGVDSLWRRGGRMRLILGIHDVPEDLIAAADINELLEEVIQAVRIRLLADVSNLADELSRERIATLAWMMQDGLLEVRVAAPTQVRSLDVNAGIFHSKRYVFRDEHGAVVTADGSPNETVMGLGGNYEELTVHMSWDDRPGYTIRHQESFERLWMGRQPGLRVVALDPTFAKELLEALRLPIHPLRTLPDEGDASLLWQVLEAARKSPAFSVMNLGTAALFPHQERAFVDAASRWPIRAVLADEVGLGKTLEAAAVIAYAIRHCDVRRITILAPAGLVRQWQDELWEHFRLDFYRYESGSRSFVSVGGEVRTVPRGLGPVGAHAPSQVVMSSQLARGDRRRGHIYKGASPYPELLVVDEAHGARVTRVPNESDRPTLLRRMLEDLLPSIPHALLLTATPMQIDVREYYDLLSLLGLPPEWDEHMYVRSLIGLAWTGDAPALQVVKSAYDGAGAALRAFRPDLRRLSLAASAETEGERLTRNPHPSPGDIIAAQERWASIHPLVVASHPGQLLTIRHTRRALEQLGYRFPTRHFEAPDLHMHAAVLRFYEAVDAYLEGVFGSVEAAAHPDKAQSLGFMKSTYRQRVASSLRAAEITLTRRRERIEAMRDGVEAPRDEVAFDEDEEELEILATVDPLQVPKDVLIYACRTELFQLDDLLERLVQLDIDASGTDPKLDTLVTLVGRHVAQGDAVLAFSRYTDTVDASIEEYRSRHLGAIPPAFGKYTGGESWIDLGTGEQPVSKEGLRRSLERGDVSVVFCSDAASEGLNLQSARVLINVDVPWNPARLEQRIGRIARLGQVAETVVVYNLWYPDSVEAKIYTRLLARKDLYDLAVGEYPEIVSRAIKAELSARYSEGLQSVVDDPIAVLQDLRMDQQLAAIHRLWYRHDGLPSGSQLVREQLVRILKQAVESLGGTSSDDGRHLALDEQHWELETEAGGTNALTLVHDSFEILRRLRPSSLDGNADLMLVLIGDTPLAFALDTGGTRRLLKPLSFPSLLEALMTGSPLKLDTETTSALTDNDPLGVVQASTPWLPDSRALTTLFEGGLKERPLQGPITMRVLGRIGVIL